LLGNIKFLKKRVQVMTDESENITPPGNKVIINDEDDNFEKTLKEVVHNLRGVFKDFI